jgi:hypothetical protein
MPTGPGRSVSSFPCRPGSIDLLLMDSTGPVWDEEAKLGKNPEQLTHGEVGG